MLMCTKYHACASNVYVSCTSYSVTLRPWRCLKSFPEGVASLSLSMSPWGAMGTPFTPISINSGHLFCGQIVWCQPETNISCSIWTHKLNYVVQNDRLALISWLLALPGPQDLCERLSSLRTSFQQFEVLLLCYKNTIITIIVLLQPSNHDYCVVTTQ